MKQSRVNILNPLGAEAKQFCFPLLRSQVIVFSQEKAEVEKEGKDATIVINRSRTFPNLAMSLPVSTLRPACASVHSPSSAFIGKAGTLSPLFR